MWTTQRALPTCPQAHQQPKKRSNDVLHKPDNLTCCLHRPILREGGRGLYGLRSELAWAGLLGGGAVPLASNTCRLAACRRHVMLKLRPHSIKPHRSSLTLYFSFGTRSADWLHRSLAAYSHRPRRRIGSSNRPWMDISCG